MLKLFWPFSQSSSPALSIPQYRTGIEEDSIDLQIKSLMYMFKRFNIRNLGPFLQMSDDGSSKLVYTENNEINSDEVNEKLDTIYNISRFQEMLIRDEYRILIDYIKNKFRSMLILSDYPKEVTSIPDISDDVSFRFSVLTSDASNEEYIQVLLNESNLYIEHNITDELKIELITSILYNQRLLKKRTGLDKIDRSFIIESYLKQLAFHVQVDRIFKASLRSKERISLPLQEENKPRLQPTKQVQIKPSFIKTQPTENSYVTKPVPLFLTSPTVKYQSPSRRKQSSPISEKSPPLKPNNNKVTIFDDSLDEDNQKHTVATTPQSSPQRTLRASPSKMKLKPVEHVPMLPPAPSLRSRSSSPQRSLNKKVSHSILRLDTKFQEHQLRDLEAKVMKQKRRNSTISSSNSDFSESGSYTTSHSTNVSLENGISNLSEIDKDTLYDQSELAVRIRIDRERNVLNGL